ncbi:hypothetical protein QTG56_23440 (plasmid) [Rossellomorea sp. AcN35-11]|nr:hypothetical protein [Rossellomorea aquimaris]WJV32319.1 hypothetical protein QTG56_23440 [Rossellomorea sp. AcN35-11]
MKINFLPDEIIRKYKIRLLNKSLFTVFIITTLGIGTLLILKHHELTQTEAERQALTETLEESISTSNEILAEIKNNELYGTLNANGKLDIENLLDSTSQSNKLNYRLDNLLYYVSNSTPPKVLVNNIKISADKMEISAQAEDLDSMEKMYLKLDEISLTELQDVKVNPLNEGSNMNVKESISFKLITVFSEHQTNSKPEQQEE